METGRLIDADALKSAFYEKCCEECGVCPEATTTDKIIGDCVCKRFASCGLIDSAPTVDAIPVAWLEAQIVPYNGDAYDVLFTSHNAMLKTIIQKWHAEQEAKPDETQYD